MESTKLKNSLTKRLTKYAWVTHADRLQIAAEMNVSRPTIDNYIKGTVSKLEFAEKLLG